MEWKISSDGSVEAAHRELLGDAEYDRRVAVANQKASELRWDEEIVYGPQFKAIMLKCNDGMFEKLASSSPEFLVRLVGKLVGAS